MVVQVQEAFGIGNVAKDISCLWMDSWSSETWNIGALQTTDVK